MQWYEILIVVAACVFVVGVVVWQIVRRKAGKGGCCGNCASCRDCAHSQKDERKK